MKVQFEFSAADLADAAHRATARSRVVRDWRWQANAMWSLLIAIALFFAISGSLTSRAIYCALFCISIFAFIHWVLKPSGPGRFIRYYRERLGGDGPFLCEVELTADGVTVRQSGAVITWPWSSSCSINDNPGDLELVFKTGGNLVVRNRAFQSQEQRSEFLRTCRDSIAAHGNGKDT
jgi:hypothetical protein